MKKRVELGEQTVQVAACVNATAKTSGEACTIFRNPPEKPEPEFRKFRLRFSRRTMLQGTLAK